MAELKEHEMDNWPNSGTDWETVLWAHLSPEMSREVKNRAGAEMVRRSGSLEAAEAVLHQRLATGAPLGSDLEWKPELPALTLPEPQGPGRWEVKTLSGSTYRIELDAEGRWWLEGENVATDRSRDIRGRRLEIARPSPWPPQIGKGLNMVVYEFNRNRYTSDVQSFRPLTEVRG